MKLIFLFPNGTKEGAKFDLNLPVKLNRKTFMAQLVAFQAFCLVAFEEHKRYASGKTTFKVPVHRPSWIGLEVEPGKVLPIMDEAGRVAKIKGYSVLNKTGKGKDMEFSANADFPRFMWYKIAVLLGQATIIGRSVTPVPVLDAELRDAIALSEANKAKAKALPEGSNTTTKESAGRKVVTA